MPSQSTDLITMSAGAARTLTENIKQVGGELEAMLVEAHDGHAWAALGYKSWSAYVQNEFVMSLSRSYQLLAQGKVNKVLIAAGSEIRATEREARNLPPMVENAQEIEQHIQERRQAPSVSIHDSHDKPRKGLSGGGFAMISLGGWLRQERENIERMENALNEDYEHAIPGLSHSDHRDLEQTAARAVNFWMDVLERCQLPAEAESVANDDWAGA